MLLSLLIYEYIPDIAERRAPHREAHLALIERYREAGELKLAGATGEGPSGGLLVFTGAAAAERFAGEDPYAGAGLITSTRIEPWNVVAHSPLEASE